MGSITLTEDSLRTISLVQELTGVTALDCMAGEDRVTLVVPKGEVGRAVGRGGERVTHLRQLLRREVLVVEYDPDPKVFVRNVFRSSGVRDVELEEREGALHAVVTVDPAKKGRAIGRGGKNLNQAQELIRRHHPVEGVVIA